MTNEISQAKREVFNLCESALNDALATGKNQIFLSKCLTQSDLICDFLFNIAGELGVKSINKGMLKLPNGALLIFVLASCRTCAGFNGNTYVINCFDSTNFSDIEYMVMSISLFEGYRTVYFSNELAEELCESMLCG